MLVEKKIIATITKDFPDIIAIYLFGSTGTKYETSESDIDIALLMPKKIKSTDRLHLINALISALHKDKIDLIDLKNAPTVLKFQIIMNGQKIHCTDNYRTDSFEMYVFSDYIRLNEERHEILEAIKKRGSIF